MKSTYHNVLPALLPSSAFVEHAIRLSDARRISEKYFQPPAALIPVFRFKLTVMRDGQDPFQVNVGNGVPVSALPFLFPGANVPVKVNPDQPGQCVIDWELAAQEAAAKAG